MAIPKLPPAGAALLHMKSDPHSGSLREPPLPRSTGERKRRPQGLAPFLYPTKVGERWRAKARRSGGIRKGGGASDTTFNYAGTGASARIRPAAFKSPQSAAGMEAASVLWQADIP